MLVVETYIGKSTISGMGLFAAEDIPEGTVMWVFDPRIDRVIRQEEMSDAPELVLEYIDKYAWVGSDGHWHIGIDNDKFCNHSVNPNKGFVHEDNTFVALRDIAKGEEITEDYSTYCSGFEEFNFVRSADELCTK